MVYSRGSLVLPYRIPHPWGNTRVYLMRKVCPKARSMVYAVDNTIHRTANSGTSVELKSHVAGHVA